MYVCRYCIGTCIFAEFTKFLFPFLPLHRTNHPTPVTSPSRWREHWKMDTRTLTVSILRLTVVYWNGLSILRRLHVYWNGTSILRLAASILKGTEYTEADCSILKWTEYIKATASILKWNKYTETGCNYTERDWVYWGDCLQEYWKGLNILTETGCKDTLKVL